MGPCRRPSRRRAHPRRRPPRRLARPGYRHDPHAARRRPLPRPPPRRRDRRRRRARRPPRPPRPAHPRRPRPTPARRARRRGRPARPAAGGPGARPGRSPPRPRPPLVLVARRDLDWPLDDRAQLAALLAHLLAPLVADLRRQGLGATRATLTRTYAERRHNRDEAIAVPLGQPTVDADHIRRLLLAAWPAAEDREADDATPPAALTALAVALAAPRPLAGRQASFFDVPVGQQARLAAGIAETARRANGELGYLRPLDPAHPLPERRYALRPADEVARLEPISPAEDA